MKRLKKEDPDLVEMHTREVQGAATASLPAKAIEVDEEPTQTFI